MALGNGCVRDMGMGPIGTGDIVFKRKFRWAFQITTVNGIVPFSIVKVAARPSLTIEETEINFQNAKMWIPGKGTWETITVTYYDVGQRGGGANLTQTLFNWLASVYDFTSPVGVCQSSRRDCYSGTAELWLFDGCGQVMEYWKMGHAWPTAVNFGELDYSSSEECTIELTLRYAEVAYLPGACGGGQPVQPICCGCV
jgi:hypothetical protein